MVFRSQHGGTQERRWMRREGLATQGGPCPLLGRVEETRHPQGHTRQKPSGRVKQTVTVLPPLSALPFPLITEFQFSMCPVEKLNFPAYFADRETIKV